MQDALAHCEALVRAADRDRYLAALFAPVGCRGALYALYAFNVEIARVREAIREPLAGEIRLQWWTDALTGNGAGNVSAHPVASALLAVMEMHRLPIDRLTALIEARRFDLYDDPMRSLADLENYGRATSSTLIELAAGIMGAGTAPGLEQVALHAGVGQAIAGLLKAFPVHAARGQLYLPVELLERNGARAQDIAARPASAQLRAALAQARQIARAHLAQAGRLVQGVPYAALPALLPVAQARPLIDRMERADYDPFVPVEVSVWRRQWRLWHAARRPSRIFG
jgi:phytoene synthase